MKVMFICTGNICRSAMAEAFMKKVAKERSLDIEVCSSGTFAENGAFASYNAIEAMKVGIDNANKFTDEHSNLENSLKSDIEGVVKDYDNSLRKLESISL